MSRKILDPLSIKRMEIKNRISFGPMLGQPFGPNGEVTDDTIGWFVERAKGEVGLAITGTVYPCMDEELIQKFAGPFSPALRLKDEQHIQGCKKLVDAVHRYGMKIGPQIGMAGLIRNASPSPYPKNSIMSVFFGADIPVSEVTLEEMDQLKKDFAECAKKVKLSGFDCLELHCAHGNVNLLAGFISPFSNRRTDQYGGTWKNQLRYPMEIIEAIRKSVGNEFPIFVRISADELLGPEGITLDDTLKYVVPMLEDAGVDCIDVSMGSQTHNPNNIPTVYVPRGHYIYLASKIKQVTRLPVIGVGRILDLKMAEKFLDGDMVDIICLGRQLIADPETPKKYFEDRPEDIRKCICDSPSPPTHPGTCTALCTVNPTPPIMGACDSVIPAKKAKSVLVVGGGVAGMEAARISALRGHNVILMEKEGRLGGHVDILANNPLNFEFRNIIEYLTSQMHKLSVNVRVCKTVTATDIKTINPDVVILATGSTMAIPKAVREKPYAITHIDALQNINAIGQNVVIQGLGYGSELAIFLAETGRKVTLFGKGKEIAVNLPATRKLAVLKRLTESEDLARGNGEIPITDKSNPTVLTEITFKDMSPRTIVVMDKSDNEEHLAYDTFVVSMGRKRNDELYLELKNSISETYRIGDANKVGEIFEAMKAANEIGRQI